MNTVDPLVKSFGYETGLRGFVTDRLNASVALWALKLDSELLFVGDAGNTEDSRRSERLGLELTTYYEITDYRSMDVEYGYTNAKFTDSAPEGDEIPGAIESVFQAGINVGFTEGWYGSLKAPRFGERSLVEDGSIKSDASTIFNLRLGYRKPDWSVKADISNLGDSNDHDIDYYYASRLSVEPPPEALKILLSRDRTPHD